MTRHYGLPQPQPPLSGPRFATAALWELFLFGCVAGVIMLGMAAGKLLGWW